ncbi:MAG: M12 family metallo-peptidase, partial [Cyanobacteriota bacterium]|nr:M12 family metallo-peptidase [Cyanobacteriota bacterium]
FSSVADEPAEPAMRAARSVVPETYRPFDASQVFNLNSNATANHTIYLDFDGHRTTGTPWNSRYGNNLVTPAYSTDSDTSRFSNAERERMWNIWQRVAEDFSPFNVNVTTEAPSRDQLMKSGSSDNQWGIRVAIGGSSSDWFGRRAGGVAYVGSFDWSTDTPTFVFENNLGNGREKFTAEAISHEVGHTLGLRHDGTSSVEYYRGHGSGDTGWAPILGNGYYRELTQWSRGEYQDADNQEDDLDIITGQNGFGYRADDYSDRLNNASTLAMNGDEVETYGIIERNTDYDWFRFTTTGDIDLDIDAFEPGANLDILARLYDSRGQLIRSSNPTDSLSAGFSTRVNSGQYFLSVTGTGQGSPATGYSDYGSLGQYSITGTIA